MTIIAELPNIIQVVMIHVPVEAERNTRNAASIRILAYKAAYLPSQIKPTQDNPDIRNPR
jgi:hypothetical protein